MNHPRGAFAVTSRILGAALTVALLTSCALAPGMYAGDLETGFTVVAHDPASGQGISVPVVPINAATLAREPSPQELPARPLPPPGIYTGYVLGPGDVVSITVWDHPELTIPQGEFRSAEAAGNLVDSDGSLYYPYCGRFTVIGMSRGQLRDALRNCLSRVIQDPQVDVRIIQFRSQRVVVGGAVQSPGVVSVTDIPLHLADALQQAGGISEVGDPRRVSLKRQRRNFDIDYKAYTETGDPRLNPLLQSGDVIHVADASERRINVLGEVFRPQSLLLNDSLRSLADALADVNGLNPQTAEAARIIVMRAGRDGPVVHWLKADDPLSLISARQFAMQPGDIVYVDQTGLNRWSNVIGQLLPSFSLVNQGSSAATR